MELEARFYRLISWKGISEPMKLHYHKVMESFYKLDVAIAGHPLILDYSQCQAGARKIAFNGYTRRLFFFNAKRQCIAAEWAYRTHTIPEETVWLIFAPRALQQNFEPLAIGAWSYSDKPSATGAAAIEYQWYTYNAFKGLRFKLLDTCAARWTISPELYDLVDEATMVMNESHRVPLFVMDREVDIPALYQSISSQDGQLFAILFTGSTDNALALYRSYGEKLSASTIPPPARRVFYCSNHLEEDRLYAREFFAEALKLSVIKRINDLELELAHYLRQWKKHGGGTTGHAIESIQKRVGELNEFFRRYC